MVRQIGKPVAVIMNRAAMPGNAEGDERAARVLRGNGTCPCSAELPFDRAGRRTRMPKGRLIAAYLAGMAGARLNPCAMAVLTPSRGQEACHA